MRAGLPPCVAEGAELSLHPGGAELSLHPASRAAPGVGPSTCTGALSCCSCLALWTDGGGAGSLMGVISIFLKVKLIIKNL